MFGSEAVPAGLFTIPSVLFRDPRYLVMIGRDEKAHWYPRTYQWHLLPMKLSRKSRTPSL